MSLERRLIESLWRLDAQTRIVADLAEDPVPSAELEDDLGTWPADHDALARVLTDELTALGADLTEMEREAAAVDDLQRDAIAESTKIDDGLRLATIDLALARDRLLHVAVATEAAEEIEGRLSRRISTIRALLR